MHNLQHWSIRSSQWQTKSWTCVPSTCTKLWNRSQHYNLCRYWNSPHCGWLLHNDNDNPRNMIQWQDTVHANHKGVPAYNGVKIAKFSEAQKFVIFWTVFTFLEPQPAPMWLENSRLPFFWSSTYSSSWEFSIHILEKHMTLKASRILMKCLREVVKKK